ncbi:MAG: serine/threonine protein kinase [Candidatus Nanoarchaeia archaeon]|nr:serine/threonine protein kinase [Candidatus Nanoarchaeia archaeon]
MVNPKLLSQGAEAKILLNEKENTIIKDRIPKSYRIKELDDKIRKQRTKAEKKLLEKACRIINAPNPFPLKEFNVIEMPYIEGKKLSEHLDSFSLEKQKEIMKAVGEETAKLHDADIIHGDLTTGNMILVDDFNDSQNYADKKEVIITSSKKRDDNSKVFFIDFGLGFISKKIEDRAVDIHLLKQALEAKHFRNWETLFNSFLKGYGNSGEAEKVLERLKAVEKRGRYRN